MSPDTLYGPANEDSAPVVYNTGTIALCVCPCCQSSACRAVSSNGAADALVEDLQDHQRCPEVDTLCYNTWIESSMHHSCRASHVPSWFIAA